ncbi:MAG: hypothetical protein ABJB11_13000 [Ferruginibacter sp.]
MYTIINIINRRFCFITLIVVLFTSCKKEIEVIQKKNPEIVLDANRLAQPIISLNHDTVYLLTSNLVRNANEELNIEAGTLIKVKNNLSITINPNGKINANGTQENPIVFTSDAAKGTAGSVTGTGKYWNGITLNGMQGTSSGYLKYVRIEFAGGNFFSSAFVLKNIDSTTLINNVQVSYSIISPAFEFNGGNFNASNLISYASVGSDFLLTNGYTGNLQNLMAYRSPYFINENSYQVAGMQIQGTNTFPTISNLSVIGPDNQPGTKYVYDYTDSNNSGRRIAALYITNNAKFHIRNTVLAGFPKTGFYIDNPSTASSLRLGESDFTYSLVHSNDSTRSFYIPDNLLVLSPPITAKDFKSVMLQPQFQNKLILKTLEYQFTDPYNYNYGLNPQPKQGSLLLSGANFDGPVFSDPFFQKVNYRGAIGENNWLQNWTNFIPLQTNYNN